MLLSSIQWTQPLRGLTTNHARTIWFWTNEPWCGHQGEVCVTFFFSFCNQKCLFFFFFLPLSILVSTWMSHKVPAVTLTLVNAQRSGLLRMKTHRCAARLRFLLDQYKPKERTSWFQTVTVAWASNRLRRCKRATAPLKFLKWGHAFRANTKTFGSPNIGTYQRCLELLRQFNPFL